MRGLATNFNDYNAFESNYDRIKEGGWMESDRRWDDQKRKNEYEIEEFGYRNEERLDNYSKMLDKSDKNYDSNLLNDWLKKDLSYLSAM